MVHVNARLWLPLDLFIAVMLHFLDIMHQTIQQPLPTNLAATSQTESLQPFIRRDVAKYRLYNRHAMTVNVPAFIAVDTPSHPVSVMCLTGFTQDE